MPLFWNSSIWPKSRARCAAMCFPCYGLADNGKFKISNYLQKNLFFFVYIMFLIARYSLAFVIFNRHFWNMSAKELSNATEWVYWVHNIVWYWYQATESDWIEITSGRLWFWKTLNCCSKSWYNTIRWRIGRATQTESTTYCCTWAERFVSTTVKPHPYKSWGLVPQVF